MDYQLGVKILYLAGITNIIFLLLTFFSCRCLMGPKLSRWFAQRDWFRRLYKYHCFFWWGFFLSVIIHTILAFYLFGNPFIS